MSTVVDYYAVQTKATLQCFKASGVDGIAHYLTASMSDPREATREELMNALDAGLEVHLMYEMNPTYDGYFTFAQGAEDCRQAQARLADVGAPETVDCSRCGTRHGFIVRFTVDENIDPSKTTEYFNGVQSAVTPRIQPGGYGFQSFCEYAFENFPVIRKHLWQTYGTPTVPLDMWQHLQKDLCGVSVDVNDCSVNGWKKEQDMAAQETYDLIAPLLQERIVAPQASTDTAIKDALALLAAHQREAALPNLGVLALTVTTRVEANLSRFLSGLVPPMPPSCPAGTRYFGESADGSVVGWTYLDGMTHYFKDGVDATQP